MDLNTIKAKIDYINNIQVSFDFETKSLYSVIDYIKPELTERAKHIKDTASNLLNNTYDDNIFTAFYNPTYDNQDKPLFALVKELGKDKVLNITFNNMQRAEAILKTHYEEATDEETKKSFERAYEHLLFDALDVLKSYLIDLYNIIILNKNKTLKTILSLMAYNGEKNKGNKEGLFYRLQNKKGTTTLRGFLDKNYYKELFTELKDSTKDFILYDNLIIIYILSFLNVYTLFTDTNPTHENTEKLTNSTQNFLRFMESTHTANNELEKQGNFEKAKHTDDAIQEYFNFSLHKDYKQIDNFYIIIKDLHDYIMADNSEARPEQENINKTYDIVLNRESTPNNISFYKMYNTDKYSKSIETTERTLQKHLTKYSPTELLKEEKQKVAAEKRLITKWRKSNPDFKGTDEEARQLAKIPHQITLKELFEEQGIIYEETKYNTNILAKDKNIYNMLNIEDVELYKTYGGDLVNVKKLCDSFILSTLTSTEAYKFLRHKTARIKTNHYLDFCGYNNKNFFDANKELDQALELLTLKSIRIEHKTHYKGADIWGTDTKRIDKANIDEETKERIKEELIKPHTTFNIIDSHRYEKGEHIIRFTDTYIMYMYLVYLNRNYITDNTKTIKTLPRNNRTSRRATFIKDYLLNKLKTDKRKDQKTDNFTQYDFYATILDLINLLKDNNQLNINRLKKDGYTETIKKPIKTLLQYLLDNKNIKIYPSIDKIFTEEKATKKSIDTFENTSIIITLLNYDI